MIHLGKHLQSDYNFFTKTHLNKKMGLIFFYISIKRLNSYDKMELFKLELQLAS